MLRAALREQGRRGNVWRAASVLARLRGLAVLAACLLWFGSSGCATWRATQAAEEVLRTEPDQAILIECREGYLGEDRDWFIAVTREDPRGPAPGAASNEAAGDDHAAPASEVIASSPRMPTDEGLTVAGGGDSVEAAFNAYFNFCKQLSDRAFDAVKEHGTPEAWRLPEDWELDEYQRKLHIFVPEADLNRALIMDSTGRCMGFVDLRAWTRCPADATVMERLRTIVTWSGDGTRLAFRVPPPDGDPWTHHLMVLDAQTGQVLHDLAIERLITDIAWSPDGTKLAVVCGEQRMGTGPLESLASYMGHGVPYMDFELLVVDLATGSMQATPVAADVQYGEAFVLWDRRAVRWMSRWIDP